MVGVADNMMVGQFDTFHLAAASFVNSTFNIPIPFGLGFSYGLTPLDGGIRGIWIGYPVGLTLTGMMLCFRYYRKLSKQSVR